MHLPSWSLRPPCRLPVLPLLAALLPVGPVPAEAEGRWALCQPLGEPPASLPPLDQQDTLISADRARAFDRNLLVLTGEARVERAGQRMDADRIEYHRDTGEALAEGGVRLEQEGMRVEAERAQLNLETRAGEMDGVRFTLFEGHAWGEATQARQENPLLRHFSEASYSTCDRENPSWLLKAREFTLDQRAQRGIVRHSVLRAWDVPVFYFPYLSFSLDDSRKTGFLFPSWGSSSTTGTDIRLPFYWNIAPHRDATLTPRYMAKRGVQLMGEFRYLNRTNSGQIDLEYLPTDKASGDRDRGFLSYRHQGRPARNLRTRINLT
ncbi:MAG TPA: LPS-assembly protein LptD, partial [Thiotrichales bacterium]|nr:LPS-assembly protein LptD [Thiotrichales bacterium]